MRAPRRHLPLILALGVAAWLIPALAGAVPPPATGSFIAVDNAFNAAGGGSTVTIAPGGKVTFAYPSGASRHNAVFTGKSPSACTPPLPGAPTGPGWASTCTFTDLGDHTFVCGLHGSAMSGTVRVAADVPLGVAAKKLTFRSRQRGLSVKGSIEITREKSSLVAGAFVRKADLGEGRPGSGQRRVGRFVRLSSVGGKREKFTVKLSKKAKRVLRQKGKLRVTIVVTVTPAEGDIVTRTKKTTLKPPR